MNKAPQHKFNGFRTPKYTQVPDQLFDELLVELSGTELKALLYIMRRTFGFKKDSDAISLSQMLRGITTREGIVLDRGAGLSKPTLLKSLRSLQKKNIIRTERRRSISRGDEPTVYSLVFAEEKSGQKMAPPVVKDVYQGGGKAGSPGPVVKEPTTQQTVDIQDTVVQQQSDDIIVALRKYGIADKVATALAENHAKDYILEKIRLMLWYVKNDVRKIGKNPPGFLRRAIEDDYELPPELKGVSTNQALFQVLDAEKELGQLESLDSMGQDRRQAE